MNAQQTKTVRRFRRKMRVRNRIRASRNYHPRLSVHKTDRHISVQLIDDKAGHTLAAASTLEKSIRSQVKNCGNMQAAVLVGKLIAERAKAKGIEKIAFDRGPFMYHGRIKSLAEAAREGGLKF